MSTANPPIPGAALLLAVASASIGAAYIQDTFKATQWLSLTGGVRQTHFSGTITENATSPRIGLSVQIPRLNWVLRAFYGQYYQAPRSQLSADRCSRTRRTVIWRFSRYTESAT